MIPLFESTSEEDVEQFASLLRGALKNKFSFTLGQSKLLHLLAELNGHSSWQSFRKEFSEGGANGGAIQKGCLVQLCRNFRDHIDPEYCEHLIKTFEDGPFSVVSVNDEYDFGHSVVAIETPHGKLEININLLQLSTPSE